jgi:hypothetical protein
MAPEATMTPNADYGLDEHVYYQNTKLVHSGQVRIYYSAGCACGWRHPKFRVTDERAVTDWFEHAERVSPNDGSRA